mgnify:CR=1 FL=1
MSLFAFTHNRKLVALSEGIKKTELSLVVQVLKLSITKVQVAGRLVSLVVVVLDAIP